MERLSLGLIGTGQQGLAHARGIAQVNEAQLLAVADINLDAAQSLAASTGATAYTDYREVLARNDIAAVVVVAPSYLHPQIVLDALHAGKHVIVEKPLAYSTADCDRMIIEAESRNLKLAVAHQMRLWPIYERVYEITRELGPITTVQCTRYSNNRRRTLPAWYGDRTVAKGMLFEVSVHELDFMCRIAGDVTEVQAVVQNYDEQKHPLAETCFVLLRFADGASGQLADSGTSTIQRWAGLISCAGGAIEFDYHASTIRAVTSNGAVLEEKPDPKAWDAIAKQHHAFARWILYGEPPAVTAREGRRVCAIAEAAYLSAERGTAIPIPPPPPIQSR